MSASVATSAASGDSLAATARRDPGRAALILGLVGVGLALVGLGLGVGKEDPRAFLGFLLGGSFWLSMAIGMLFLVVLSYIFDAGWMVVVRRPLEHGLGAFRWLALLFAPLLVLALLFPGNGSVPWIWMGLANPTATGEPVGSDPLFLHKSGYLHAGFFFVRFLLFFAIWTVTAECLRRASFAMDGDGDPRHVHFSRRVAAVGAILGALATTFAAIDWFKSIEYHWFSTMYGVWFFSASMRCGLAGIAIICYLLARGGWLKGLYRDGHSYMLGCLMLAFTVFWAYISFSQYFIIYNANIPEETYWYVIREIDSYGAKNSWWWVSLGLVFGHFLVPFVFLLWRSSKFGRRLLFISIWILAFHALDLYWNIIPGKVWEASLGHYVVRPFSIHWVDLASLVGVGGVLVWAFLRSAARTRPIPIRDPRIAESLNCHE